MRRPVYWTFWGWFPCPSHQTSIPRAFQHHHPTLTQDAESFEAKRSRGRGERGGEPAWASARVAAKRGAEEQARLQSEIDEDDAFAVRREGKGETRTVMMAVISVVSWAPWR